jgi:hypothetical protein
VLNTRGPGFDLLMQGGVGHAGLKKYGYVWLSSESMFWRVSSGKWGWRDSPKPLCFLSVSVKCSY